MNATAIRKIIKENNLNVQVKARTNGTVKAIAFDVDDLVTLNAILRNECGQKFITEFAGTKFEHFPLRKVGA